MNIKGLVGKVGEVGQDNLIAHAFPRALTTAVKVATGENVLPRGTILTTEDGTSYKALTGETKGQANCILADEVDATSEDIVAAAYITGNFNINAVSGKPAEEVDIDFEVQDALRKYGIILSDMRN